MHPPLSATAADPALTVVLGLAAIGSAAVLLVALKAFERRRTLSYLLVALAIATLLGRTLLGGLTVGGAVSPGAHHVAEHGFDIVLVVLLVGAVYAARTSGRPTGSGGEEP